MQKIEAPSSKLEISALMPPPTTVPLAPKGKDSGSGFDQFEIEEAERFRRDVQGEPSAQKRVSAGGTLYAADNDWDEEIGPQPMAKPKEFAQDKPVTL